MPEEQVESFGQQSPLGRPGQRAELARERSEVEICGSAEVLPGDLPDPERDVVAPLVEAGYPRSDVASLGEGI